MIWIVGVCVAIVLAGLVVIVRTYEDMKRDSDPYREIVDETYD